MFFSINLFMIVKAMCYLNFYGSLLFISSVNAGDSFSNKLKNINVTKNVEVVQMYESPERRLPKSLIPVKYYIKLYPNEDKFWAFVAIEIQVLEPTSSLLLHMENIIFDSDPQISIYKFGKESGENINNLTYDHSNNIMTFDLNRTLRIGDNFVFSAVYHGLTYENSLGLNSFSSTLRKSTGRRLLATHLQPSGARRVFPCFDEPDFKAFYTLEIAGKNTETVLSNMPINRKRPIKDDSTRSWFLFQMTPKMSTYLVAFVICDFHHNTVIAEDGQKIRIYAEDDVLPRTNKASELSTKLLTKFSSMLGIAYPISKLDFVALPNYPAIAMENFGLIITRESGIACKESLYQKHWISTITAHEVAHQWIGNLITPAYWSEFWLSEGFATYLSAIALEQLEPDYESLNHMLVENVATTKREDVGSKAFSLVSNKNLFVHKNIGVYYKGAAVLRMLCYIVGSYVFETSIISLFNKFQYQSFSQANLMDEIIAKYSMYGNTLKLDEIMKSWTSQKGYPLLHVAKHSNGTVFFRQECFNDKNSVEDEPLKGQWWMPLTFAIKSNPLFNNSKFVLLQNEEHAIHLPGNTNEDWIVANTHQTAYMRINYDKRNWKRIIRQIEMNHEVFPVLNRAQFIDDSLYLFITNHLSVNIPMTLISYMKDEVNLFPWIAAFQNLGSLNTLMKGTYSYHLFQKYILSLITPALEKIGKDDVSCDIHSTKVLRRKLLAWSCAMGDQSCSENARNYLKLWKTHPDRYDIFPEYGIEEYLCAAIENGNTDDWKFAFNQFTKMKNRNISFESQNQLSESYFTDALSCANDEDIIINSFLEETVKQDSVLTLEDTVLIYNSLVRSKRWGKVTWNFIRDNFISISLRYGSLPIPFIITKDDLYQFRLFKAKFKVDPALLSLLDATIEENKPYAKVNNKLIINLSIWLLKNVQQH